ncbi:hypothetical protein, partial [Staphylococcus aureus]
MVVEILSVMISPRDKWNGIMLDVANMTVITIVHKVVYMKIDQTMTAISTFPEFDVILLQI